MHFWLKLGKITIAVGVNFAVQSPLELTAVDRPVNLNPQLIAQNPSYEQALNAKIQPVTVVINGQNPGSGVIIGQQGNTYVVLTANHVVATPDEYEIITADGQSHVLEYRTVKKLPNVDLALVEFTSSQTYAIAEIGDSNAAIVGDSIYIAGWPHPGQAITSRIFQMTGGQISGRALGAAEDGYDLVYTNVTRSGMSGGPIFDRLGRLIGIHGRAEGAQIYDPDTGNTLAIKAGFNLGIPMQTLIQLTEASSLPPNLTFAYPLSTLGDRALTNNQISEATQYYQDALNINPESFAALFGLGQAKYESGDIAAAISDLKSAVAIATQELELKQAQIESGTIDPLESTAENITSQQINAQISLAAVFYASGKLSEGLELVSAALFKNNQGEIDIAKLFSPSDRPTPNNPTSALNIQLASPQLSAKVDEILAYFAPTKTLSHAGDIISVDISSQGLVASASSEGNTILWNLSSGENIATLTDENPDPNAVKWVKFSPDGQIITIVNGGNLNAIDLSSETPVQVPLPNDFYVNYVEFSPDSQSLAISGIEQLLLWKISNNQILNLSETSAHVVAFSPNGQILATNDIEEYSIKLWNADNGELLNTLSGHSDWIRSLAFSANGEFLASISYDGTVRLWNLSTGEQTIEQDFISWDIDFSPNAQTLAIASTYGLVLLDGNTGTSIRISDASILSVAFSADGKTLVTGQSNMEDNLKFWRVPSF